MLSILFGIFSIPFSRVARYTPSKQPKNLLKNHLITFAKSNDRFGIINNCVDPQYRPMLNEYLEMSKTAHTPHTLSCALAMHEEFLKSGDMRNTKWENYKR